MNKKVFTPAILLLASSFALAGCSSIDSTIESVSPTTNDVQQGLAPEVTPIVNESARAEPHSAMGVFLTEVANTDQLFLDTKIRELSQYPTNIDEYFGNLKKEFPVADYLYVNEELSSADKTAAIAHSLLLAQFIKVNNSAFFVDASDVQFLNKEKTEAVVYASNLQDAWGSSESGVNRLAQNGIQLTKKDDTWFIDSYNTMNKMNDPVIDIAP